MAARHLGHEVGGGRRNDDEVGLAREADMADLGLVVAIEQVGMRCARRESAATASGVTKCCAASVRMQRTTAPRSRRRRIRSSDL